PIRDTLIEGFSHFVTSMTAPIASGWSDVAGRVSHPLESAALSRRTPSSDIPRKHDVIAGFTSARLVSDNVSDRNVMKRIKIGDVIAIPTALGIAYAQYTHKHPQFGSLLRVFERIHSELPLDLSEIPNGLLRFSTFFPLGAAVNRRIFSVVGNFPVTPSNQNFPLFRDGVADLHTKKVCIWWLWDGTREWKVGALSEEQKRYPIRKIVNDTMLVYLIETDWRAESEV
ncbi:MAG: hypothetical protein P4L57_11510, partial [Rhizomicrobium sp.]|nr:hypothetical protein [Rhizomicrobium sp.]